MKKKIISLILAVVMVVGVIPMAAVTALAEAGDNEQTISAYVRVSRMDTAGTYIFVSGNGSGEQYALGIGGFWGTNLVANKISVAGDNNSETGQYLIGNVPENSLWITVDYNVSRKEYRLKNASDEEKYLDYTMNYNNRGFSIGDYNSNYWSSPGADQVYCSWILVPYYLTYENDKFCVSQDPDRQVYIYRKLSVTVSDTVVEANDQPHTLDYTLSPEVLPKQNDKDFSVKFCTSSSGTFTDLTSSVPGTESLYTALCYNGSNVLAKTAAPNTLTVIRPLDTPVVATVEYGDTVQIPDSAVSGYYAHRWIIENNNGRLQLVADGTTRTPSYRGKKVGTANLRHEYSTSYAAGSTWHTEYFDITVEPAVPTVTLADTRASYTGSPIAADAATVTLKNDEKYWGSISYTYYKEYLDEEYYTLTSAADGALTDGGAPSKLGTYKVVASVSAFENYTAATSTPAALTIVRADLADVSVEQDGPLPYNGQAQIAPVRACAAAQGDQTVTFAYFDNESGMYGESVPAFTEIGNYTVYYMASAPYHNTATGHFTVTISRGVAAVTAAPVLASSMKYDGTAHALLTAPGEAADGTMEYFTATTAMDAGTAALQDGWSTVCEETNAGTYYVWYRAVPTDTVHYDSSTPVLAGVVTIDPIVIGSPAYHEFTGPLTAGDFVIACPDGDTFAALTAANGGLVQPVTGTVTEDVFTPFSGTPTVWHWDGETLSYTVGGQTYWLCRADNALEISDTAENASWTGNGAYQFSFVDGTPCYLCFENGEFSLSAVSEKNVFALFTVLKPAIAFTDLTVPETGDAPDFTAAASAGDSTLSVAWFAGDTPLEITDTFAYQEVYNVRLTLTPAEGHAFLAAENAYDVTLNGEAVTYSIINGELVISRTFGPTPCTHVDANNDNRCDKCAHDLYVDRAGALDVIPDEADSIGRDTAELSDGWYVLDATAEIAQSLRVVGNAHVVVKDGCTLTVGGIEISEPYTLTVYAQQAQSGRIVTVSETAAGLSGTLDLVGGTLTAIGGENEAGLSGDFSVYAQAVIKAGENREEAAAVSAADYTSARDRYVMIYAPHDHDFTDVDYTVTPQLHGKICLVCGDFVGSQAHTFDENHVCTVCEYHRYLAFGVCGDDLTWILDRDNVLTVSGTGAMWDYFLDDPAPWAEMGSSIRKVVLEDGVTSIGGLTFMFSGLTELSLPESLRAIGANAFTGNTGLTSLTIPGDGAVIGLQAFYGCSALESVTVTGRNTVIGVDAFRSCESLKTLTVTGSVAVIEATAFANDAALTDVTISDGITRIGEGAFGNGYSLAGIYFTGNAPTELGDYAFASCMAGFRILAPSYRSWKGAAYNAEAGTWNGIPIEFYDAPEYTGASLTLGDAVNINFYMLLTEDQKSKGTMTFTFCGRTVEGILQTGDNGDFFAFPLNVLEMAETVTAAFSYEGREYVLVYSVPTYAEHILSGSYPAEAKLAARKLINYGYYAQQYLASLRDEVTFGEDGYKPLTPYTDDAALTAAVSAKALSDNHTASLNGNADGLSLYGLSVMFDNAMALNYYVTVESGLEPGVTCAKPFTVEKVGTKLFRITVGNIAAHELATGFAVKIGGADFSASVLNYAAAVVAAHSGSSDGDVSAVNAMAALYEYYMAVIACQIYK